MTRPLPQPVRVYRVGGSVRDELLGRPPGDQDWVVVGATPEMLLASGYTPVGKDFPVFLHPETRDEYALARTERKHGRGYRGFEFFATPEVTLEDDLRRRDLTINAMARAEDGTLIDPYGGQADLRAGILRHVSPTFVEDPLRVLRVARFAARFDFPIAPETLALMRDIVASGELDTVAPERVWQELARGLAASWPSRMLEALRACGALAILIPEVDALYAVPLRDDDAAAPAADDAGRFTERALDFSATRHFDLTARYAALTQELDRVAAADRTGDGVSTRAGIARAERVSARLRVPIDCRDAARLAARWHRALSHADRLAPAELLDIIVAADALRRPERLETLIAAASAHVAARQAHHDAGSGPTIAIDAASRMATLLHEALSVVRGVDAAAIARDAIARAAQDTGEASTAVGDAIGTALRDARLNALRDWKRAIPR